MVHQHPGRISYYHSHAQSRRTTSPKIDDNLISRGYSPGIHSPQRYSRTGRYILPCNLREIIQLVSALLIHPHPHDNNHPYTHHRYHILIPRPHSRASSDQLFALQPCNISWNTRALKQHHHSHSHTRQTLDISVFLLRSSLHLARSH